MNIHIMKKATAAATFVAATLVVAGCASKPTRSEVLR